MGIMRLRQITFHFSLAILVASALLGASFSTANAASSSNPCIIQNTLPAGESKPRSQFGDLRSSRHSGTDFFYSGDQIMNVPQGCVLQKNPSGNLVWEQKGKKANGDPDGWGWYVVFDCGQQGSHTIKMRVAHVPKQPFGAGGTIRMGCSGNAGAPGNRNGEVSHGCSGSGEHYHIETFIGDQAVDTECIWGLTKTNQNIDNGFAACKSCPQVGQPNLCDANVRQALIQQGASCIGKKGVAPAASTSSGVDPNSIKGGEIPPPPTNPPPQLPNIPDGDGGHTHEHGTPEGGPGHTPPDIFVPPETPDPPPEPPAPDVPGTPGDSPNLVPEPKPGEEPEELSGCAADTWTAMVNQAVIEARREDILNKRFIVKPDSVLDYSCFDMFVKKVADDAGPVFSETKKWANLEVDLIGKKVIVKRELGSKSLDAALMDIVQSVATNYRRRQFNQPLLSGSASVPANAGATSCDLMSQVWKAAKCKNFDEPSVFYSFEDLKTVEPRIYPPNLRCN